MIGHFSEDTVRVFAAELGCALGKYARSLAPHNAPAPLTLDVLITSAMPFNESPLVTPLCVKGEET